MKVTLVSMTQPVAGGATTPEDLVVYCARVSSPQNQSEFASSERLIRYLLKKGHWSPFEMVDLTFEIKTTRDIGRQILRHRSFSFQEFSQRYATVDAGSFEERECRMQDAKNRQASHECEDDKTARYWAKAQRIVRWAVSVYYKGAIERGIAKEQARAILPEGMTPTTMYMKGSLRSWFHFCLVRCNPGTQKEHREIALEVWDEIGKQFSFFRDVNMVRLSANYPELFEGLLERAEA